jgi:hypothetical protein
MEKKTGRPKIHPESEKVIKKLYPNITTRMGINNKIYELRAFKLIKVKAPEIADKFEFKGIHPKSSLLAEIGRWEDEEKILEMARKYVQTDLNVNSFIVFSRYLRLNA